MSDYLILENICIRARIAWHQMIRTNARGGRLTTHFWNSEWLKYNDMVKEGRYI